MDSPGIHHVRERSVRLAPHGEPVDEGPVVALDLHEVPCVLLKGARVAETAQLGDEAEETASTLHAVEDRLDGGLAPVSGESHTAWPSDPKPAHASGVRSTWRSVRRSSGMEITRTSRLPPQSARVGSNALMRTEPSATRALPCSVRCQRASRPTRSLASQPAFAARASACRAALLSTPDSERASRSVDLTPWRRGA